MCGINKDCEEAQAQLVAVSLDVRHLRETQSLVSSETGGDNFVLLRLSHMSGDVCILRYILPST